MPGTGDLKIDWAGYAAAKYAVQNWHYSQSLPPPPHVRVGAWEGDRFLGVVLFSRGANKSLLAPFGLKVTEGCELTRIALREHEAPVSQILSGAIKLLRQQCPGLRLILSFADPAENHLGVVYMASNWVYLGMSAPSFLYRERRTGRLWHPRMVSVTGRKRVFGHVREVVKLSDCEKVPVPGKHRYALGLDRKMRRQLDRLAQPYPRRHGEVPQPRNDLGRCDPCQQQHPAPAASLERRD